MATTKLLLCAFLAALTITIQADGVRLVSGGTSQYQIVLPQQPSLVEKTAASELQSYIRKISGAELPVISAPTEGKHVLLLGWSPRVRELLKTEASPSSMHPDQVILKSFDSGEVVITGHPDRGVLYAVYTLLEEKMGVRWWSGEDETVPINRNITISPLDVSYYPPFSVRVSESAEFVAKRALHAARMRLNSENIPEELGGSSLNGVVANRSHTMGRLVPDEAVYKELKKYFPANYVFPGTVPEYYSLRDGRRVTGWKGQLCLTNADIRKIMISNAIDLLKRKAPHNRQIVITQNDNTNFCECEKCKTKVVELGNQTDLMIWFLNGIIRELDREFPGVIVETYAYQYTMPPPKTVIPDPNIMIRFCLIEQNAARPITDPSNAALYNGLVGWSKITKRLSIWNYITNFTDFTLIHPNFMAMAPDLKQFAELGVCDVFSQDSYSGGKTGFFPEFRGYLSAHLLWNPNADVDAITKDFFNGYYGLAAPSLLKYFYLYHQVVGRSDVNLICNMMDTARWLPWEVLLEGDALIAQAIQAASADPELLKRVKRIQTCQNWSKLWRIEGSCMRGLLRNPPAGVPEEIKKLYGMTIAAVQQLPPPCGYKKPQASEARFFDSMLIRLNGRLASAGKHVKLPTSLENTDSTDLVILPEEVYEMRAGNLIDDAFSPVKRAARVKLGKHNWPMVVSLPAFATGDEFEILMEARFPVAVENAKGVVMRAGIYQYSTNFTKKSVYDFKAEDFSNREYRLFSLGKCRFERDYQVYIEGCDNPTVPEILIGRIFIRRVK